MFNFAPKFYDMDLSKIMTISGKPGLYEMVAQTKTSLVVESLEDKKRFPVFGKERISSLEEISVFTENEDLVLKDVFKKISDMQDGKEAISHKSDNAEVKEFFKKAVPDYDEERVYVSDMKKIINWYNILVEKNLLEFKEEEEENAEDTSEEKKKENDAAKEEQENKDDGAEAKSN